MDSLECISADVSLDDELDFLHFALNAPGIRLVLPHADVNGPAYASIQEWPIVRDKQEFVLLWNFQCSNPLCWEVRLPFQGLPDFLPIGQQTQQAFLSAHVAFEKMPITAAHFKHGMFLRGLSPVVEVSHGGCLVMTIEFTERPTHAVWLVWDATRSVWVHEARELELMYEKDFKQPHDSIRWQESLLDWVYTYWWDKIDRRPSWSYRYNSDGNFPSTWRIRLLRRRCKMYWSKLKTGKFLEKRAG
jgi:hypothetical protein